MRLSELPVYVIHGRRLVDRRLRLSEALAAQGITAEWITDPDASGLTRALRRRYYRKDRGAWELRAADTPKPSTRYRALTPVEVAATISHVTAFERIARSGSGFGLVLEDDAVFGEDFARSFDRYFDKLPPDADMVFLGDAYGFRIADPDPAIHFHRKDHPAAKCTDSYVLRASAAEKLLSTIVPFTFPIDWELNYHLKRHDLVVYWLEPPLVSQGSFTGVHPSSIALVRWRATLSPLFKLRLLVGRVIRWFPGGAALLRARRGLSERRARRRTRRVSH